MQLKQWSAVEKVDCILSETSGTSGIMSSVMHLVEQSPRPPDLNRLNFVLGDS
jgi:hypothetical protein